MDIRISHVTKRYGTQKAVDDISFEVKQGEILGFLGPNGAGKTTTMKMITGYLAMGEGDIFLGDRSVKDEPDSFRKHIGYLAEHNPLYDEMPVIDFLIYMARLQGVANAEVDARVKKMIRLCGLNPEKHKRIAELSKGYRQRVGLAQALIHDPEILILDEPTTGLDPNQIIEIRNLIRELGSNKTVILSTHILPEVEATCDRILIINKGKIVADGTPETLRKAASGASIYQMKIEDGEPMAILDHLRMLNGVLEVKWDGQHFRIEADPAAGIAREVFALCVKHSWVLTALTQSETRLEDVFRGLTVGESKEILSHE